MKLLGMSMAVVVLACVACGKKSGREAGAVSPELPIPSRDAQVRRVQVAPRSLTDLAVVTPLDTNAPGPVLIAAGLDRVVLRSGDGGITWYQMWPAQADGADFTEVAVGGPGEVWLLSRSELLYSPDAGLTWSAAMQPPGGFYYFGAVSVRPGVCEMIQPPSYGASVYRSRDGGRTWHKLTGLLPHNDYRVVAFASDELGWLGGPGGRMACTTDGGATWTEQALGTAVEAVAGIRDGRGREWMLPGAGQDGHLWVSDDVGRTWQSRTFDLPSYWSFRDLASQPGDRTVVLAGRGADGARLLGEDGAVIFDTAFRLQAMVAVGDVLWFAGDDGGIYRTLP